MLALLLAPPAARAEDERLFVLPVARSRAISDGAARILEERLAIALGETRRVRVLSERDVPAAERRGLPRDLASCESPDCLKRLGRATGAAQALAVRIAEDERQTVMFAQLYDARTGESLRRKEWPAAPPAAGAPPAERIAELGRWAVGIPEPPTAVAATPAFGPPPAPGLVAFEAAPGRPPSSEARALLGAITARLSGNPAYEVLPAGSPLPAGAAITHRAVVSVDRLSVSTRIRHVRHYRQGVLAATLTISSADGGVVFMARADAATSERARHTTEQQVVEGLVRDVVDDWVRAFRAEHVDRRLKQRRTPR
jgi:hypothetical protein